MAISLPALHLPFTHQSSQKSWLQSETTRLLSTTISTEKALSNSKPSSASPLFSRKAIPKPINRSLSSFISYLFQDDEAEEDQDSAAATRTDDEQSSSERRTLDETWRKLHGQDDWAGLLDPMDPLLRSELIRYGEMAQACYDAFDFDPFSKYCGSCRFSRPDFFKSLDKQSYGYQVSRYLYATSNINLPNVFKKSRWPKVWSKNANWIGYVAVSTDEMSKRLGRRDISIARRGTVTRLEWIADLMDYLRPVSADKIPCPDPAIKAEAGFLDLYTDKDQECKFCNFSAREQILAEVKRLIELYSNEELSITMTGHSLGSALAILSAYDLAETGINIGSDGEPVPVCVYSFSGPRVGNVRFKERVERLGVKVLRVVNVHDMVLKSPGLFLNENAPPAVMKLTENLPWSYSHVGVELALDHMTSPFLKPTGDPVCAHNLEAHLHLVDGIHVCKCKAANPENVRIIESKLNSNATKN